MTSQIKIMQEPLVGLSDLAKLVPSRRRPGPLSAAAIYRWATRGVRRADGAVVRLETVTIAGRLLSSREALERFVAAQATPANSASLPINGRTPARRLRASQGAADALGEIGI